MYNCSDIIVINNNYEQNFESLHICNTMRIDIFHNTFRNNEYGIRTYGSSKNNVLTNIINNYFYENHNGIECDSDLSDFNIHNNSYVFKSITGALTFAGAIIQYKTKGLQHMIDQNRLEKEL